MSVTSIKARKQFAVRPILAALVLTMAMASVVTVASPAAADHTVCTRNYRFAPTWIHAQDIEDWFDWADEIQLSYPGTNYRTTINHMAYKYDMPDTVVTAVPGSTFNVSLYEWDGSSRRTLGSRSLYWAATSGEREVHFYRSGDYSYFLRYEVVDEGPETCVQYVAVPNVVGWPASDARARLEAAGFQVDQRNFASCNPDPSSWGVVDDQNPKSGEKPRGSTVAIYVGYRHPNYSLCDW